MANKLEPIAGKQSKWQGLWYQKNLHCFSSAVINLAELKKFKGNIRIKVVKNSFYKDGENRPNYVFTIIDANDAKATDIQIENANHSKGAWKYTWWWEGVYEIWTYKCSECGYKLADGLCYNPPNFCPDCGADMRGETEDGE